MDLDVQATLDLHMFPDKNEVLQLLKAHNFKVTKQGSDPDMVLLEGTFLNLRAVRPQLQKHLQENGHHTEHRANRNRPVSASDGIATGAFRKDSHSPLSLMNGSHHGHVVDGLNTNSSEAYSSERSLAVSRSPASLDRSSASSYQSVSSYYHSRDLRSSGHPGYLLKDSGAPQSLPIFPSNTLTTKPPLPLGTSSSRETTFQVDADLLHYTWSFRKDDVDNILKTCGVQDTTNENAGVTTVVLVGKDPERAKQKLLELTHVTSLSLYTQEIPLSQLRHLESVQIAKRIQIFKDMYNVYIRQSPTSIVIVGSSTESYEMKQRLLGESVVLSGSTRTGREAVRGPKTRRSASLPKQPKSRPDQFPNTQMDSPPGYASMAYSPSNYKDEKEFRGNAIVGSRRRTSSESREWMFEHRPQPKAESEHMSPSSGATMPQVKKSALNVFDTKSIKKKWHDMTTKSKK